ncbi:FtsB family cell division protein [Streptomyces sp. NBC_00670]|uniref:FtsB family cell division protein n=1 Tax=Streptomyces sp. NBC_00670 TaxID=2975804 RepID=UPI002E35E549|nr:septum formation initiator family protein [Streptomyces sp. NBC_00670]
MSRKPQLKGRAARLARLFPAARGRAARTPFVLLVVLLLGGGLIGLLMLNSALSAGSFRLDDLQQRTKDLTDEEQALQRDVDAYSAPDALQRRARELGMVPGGTPAFLGPDGTVKGEPSPAASDETLEQSALESTGGTVEESPGASVAASAGTAAAQPLSAPGTPPQDTAPAPGATSGPTAPAMPATTPGR